MSTSDPEFAARFEQMGRFFLGTSDVHQALTRVTERLEELRITYAVCGAMAVNAHGLQRATTDVDVLLTPEASHASRLHRSGSASSRGSPAAAACATLPPACRFDSC